MYTIDSSMTGSHLSNSAPAKRKRFGWLRNERGSNLIEMVFVITLMLSFVVGAVDLGLAYQHYGVVLNASREGARLYGRLPCTGSNRTALRNAIINAAVAEPGSAGGGVINGNGAAVSIRPSDVQITPDLASGCPAPGTAVTVRVSVLYRSQFGELLGLGAIPISASATMMHYGADTAQGGS